MPKNALTPDDVAAAAVLTVVHQVCNQPSPNDMHVSQGFESCLCF